MADQQNDEIICMSCQTLQEAGSEALESIAPNTSMCRECVVNGLLPRFHAALRYEHQYPVEVGSSVRAHPRSLAADFNEDFLKRFERKETEYHTPVKDRVYCTAHIKEADHVEGAALNSQLIALNPEQAEAARAAGEAVRVCGAMVCNRNTTTAAKMPCYHCGSITKVPVPQQAAAQPGLNSDISQQAGATDEKDTDAFADLVLGRDFNYCPNPKCKIAISLKEACTHMICGRCRTHFCIVCGVETKAERGLLHWTPPWGKCPLYGQPHLETNEERQEREEREREAEQELEAEQMDAELRAIVQDFNAQRAVIEEARRNNPQMERAPQPADDPALDWPSGVALAEPVPEEEWSRRARILVIDVPRRNHEQQPADAPLPARVQHGNEIFEQVIEVSEPEELPGDVPPLPPMRPDSLRTRRLRALWRRRRDHGLGEELVIIVVFSEIYVPPLVVLVAQPPKEAQGQDEAVDERSPEPNYYQWLGEIVRLPEDPGQPVDEDVEAGRESDAEGSEGEEFANDTSDADDFGIPEGYQLDEDDEDLWFG